MMERRQIKIDGLSLSYLEKGMAAKDQPSLVLLHGLMGCADTFVPLMQELHPDLHVIALDLPGHGRSSHRPPGASYPYIEYLPDLETVIDQLDWDKFTLIGHSLGGALAAAIAALHPERIEKLVLLEALGPMTGSEEDLPDRLQTYLEERKK